MQFTRVLFSGFESSHIGRILQPVEFTMMLYEAQSGVPGMHTTHQSKEVMHSLLLERLRDGSLAYAKTFVTTGDAEKLQKQLNTQVTNYSVIVDRPHRMDQPFKWAKKTYSPYRFCRATQHIAPHRGSCLRIVLH